MNRFKIAHTQGWGLWLLFQDEPGPHLDPAAEAEQDRLNGGPGSTSSAAVHHAAGPKKRRHRITRHEKDKDQHVGEDLWQLWMHPWVVLNAEGSP